MRGLSLVMASGGHSSSRCTGLSLLRPLLLWSTSSRRASSVIVAHGPSCSPACGIFPDQGSNPCPLHWQADSQPLRHQGSPNWIVLMVAYKGESEVEEARIPVFKCQVILAFSDIVGSNKLTNKELIKLDFIEATLSPVLVK